MYLKDSAILVLRATEDGYFVQMHHWVNHSPPPESAEIERVLENASVEPTNRQDRISADKAELKNELSAFVDNFFDV